MAKNDVQGVVEDANGDPVDGATVYAIRTDTTPAEYVGMDTSGPSGEYLIPAKFGGEVHLVAEWEPGEVNFRMESNPFISVSTLLQQQVVVTGGSNSTATYEYSLSDGSWESLTDNPELDSYHELVESGSKLYLIAGQDSDNNVLDSVYVYEPTVEEWSSIESYPTEGVRGHTAAASANGKIYSIGGLKTNYSRTDEAYEYDPSVGSWSSITSHPYPVNGHRAEAVDREIYTIGGYDGSDNVGKINEYAPYSDSWETLSPSMPTVHRNFSSASAGGKIYTVGGIVVSTNEVSDTVYEFDPSGRSWSSVAPYPTTIEGASAVGVEGQVYVIGGYVDGANDVNSVYRYDPPSDSWSQLANYPKELNQADAAYLTFTN